MLDDSNIERKSGGDMLIAFRDKFSIRDKADGIHITIDQGFHNEIRRRYPTDTPPFTPEVNAYGCENCPARLVFSQLRTSIRNGVTSEAYYESKIIELMFLLGGDSACKSKLPERDLQAVNSVKSIICSRICDCPKITELAVMTGTSQSKLQNDFKTAFGITIHEYLWETRMSKAIELLETSDAPVYAIATEVGCRKAGRFSEMFRRTYGISPNEYRRVRIG